MHELSIVMGIVDIAERQAAIECSAIIEEIELDIGCLTNVEINAFEMAWKQAVKNTVLANAVKKINRIEGKANCAYCSTTFPIYQLYDACPTCGGHFFHIMQGKELKVRSLVVS